MDALCVGFNMLNVARRMGVHENTVRTFVTRARHKLGARSSMQAVSIWTAIKVRSGLWA